MYNKRIQHLVFHYNTAIIRSSFSADLAISTRRATVGGRGFSADATSVWYSLPEAVGHG